jgi:hypothetical protein
LLLASATVPFDAALAEQTLGVKITTEKSCDYMPDDGRWGPVALWDLVLHTTPPVRVKSGERAQVTLEGRAYSVWMTGGRFALYAL